VLFADSYGEQIKVKGSGQECPLYTRQPTVEAVALARGCPEVSWGSLGLDCW
jgi:hypothetical protein